MSVYRKFHKSDILSTTVHGRPNVSASFGATGWTGNTGVSASLSLYGGVRSRTDVKQSDFSSSGLSVYPLDELDTHSIDKVIQVSGSYPSTGSIRFVRCDNLDVSASLSSLTQWHASHYRPIELLYEYYKRFDDNFFIGNYDFYSCLFTPDITAVTGAELVPGPRFIFSGAFSQVPLTSESSSFTVMAHIKPYQTMGLTPSGSAVRKTIFSQKALWSFEHSYSGSLLLRNYQGTALASNSQIEYGKWNTVAVVVDSGVSASFYVNGNLEEKVELPFLFTTGSELQPLIVGCGSNISGLKRWAFSGYIFDTMVWNKTLSKSELDSYFSGTLINSSSANLIHYSRFNDGPYSTAHGFALGSGAFDYSTYANHGYSDDWSVNHYTRWQPNDHPSFIAKRTKTNLGNEDIRVIHIPSMFYGRQINPGSVVIKDGVYNELGIVRVFNDDGRGGLYLSGSTTRQISSEDYTGETRRKVGNVFYTEGLIVFTDPSLRDMFSTSSMFWDSTETTPESIYFSDLLSINFEGQSRVESKIFNCRAPAAALNASNNSTFSYFDNNGTEDADDDRMVVLRNDGRTYITAIGLYNEDRKLVAVAKLAQPVRKREKDKLNIRLKLDF